MAKGKLHISRRTQCICGRQLSLLTFQPLAYVRCLPARHTPFCPVTIAHRLLQKAQIFHSRSLIPINQIDFCQTLDSSCPGMLRRENHPQDGGMFCHRHVSQSKPDFISRIDCEISGAWSYRQEQSLRSRLIVIHQVVGQLPLLRIQQVIIISGERRAVFLLSQQFPDLFPATEIHFRVQSQKALPSQVGCIVPFR